MSIIIPKSAIDLKTLVSLDKTLRQKRINKFTKRAEVAICDTSFGESFKIPLAVANEHRIAKHTEIATLDWKQGDLRDYQYAFLASNYHRMSMPCSHGWEILPGLGKTVMAIALLDRLKALYPSWKAEVFLPRRCLIAQWKTHISDREWIVAKMILEAKSCQAELVIVDEAHLSLTRTSLKDLFSLQPKFLLGLSGTFWRTDILDVHLRWLFGEPLRLNSSPTSRELTLHPVHTNIRPTIKHTPYGRLDWNVVLKSLSENKSRNSIILDILAANDRTPGLRTLVLTKFISHNTLLVQGAKSRGIELEVYDEKAPLSKNLVATFKKCGTGLSLDGFGAVILAIDVVDYTLQYISRVIRSSSCVGHIWDLVDKHPSLKKHHQERAKVYSELGISWR